MHESAPRSLILLLIVLGHSLTVSEIKKATVLAYPQGANDLGILLEAPLELVVLDSF